MSKQAGKSIKRNISVCCARLLNIQQTFPAFSREVIRHRPYVSIMKTSGHCLINFASERRAAREIRVRESRCGFNRRISASSTASMRWPAANLPSGNLTRYSSLARNCRWSKLVRDTTRKRKRERETRETPSLPSSARRSWIPVFSARNPQPWSAWLVKANFDAAASPLRTLNSFQSYLNYSVARNSCYEVVVVETRLLFLVGRRVLRECRRSRINAPSSLPLAGRTGRARSSSIDDLSQALRRDRKMLGKLMLRWSVGRERGKKKRGILAPVRHRLDDLLRFSQSAARANCC